MNQSKFLAAYHHPPHSLLDLAAKLLPSLHLPPLLVFTPSCILDIEDVVEERPQVHGP